MRLHFPIVTNDSVMFTTWNVDGTKKEIHMKRGECWYLDTRKPHRAINTGKTDRLHLVVDVDANDNIRGLLC
jgi:mannose-6-phosphate isomerase-like protein (cupin superfamily)